MKLSASINFYNAEELLIQAVRCVRPLVEHLSIVYQETSNWGNVISERAKKTIEQLKSEGLVDDFYCYEPNLSFNASENEFQKRQIGLDLAKAAGASHFLLMDADEFYIPKQFLKAKEIIRANDISYSCVRSYFYIHQSIYRSELPDTTNVCFIAKITPELSFEYQGAFPAENVDPTRRLVNSSGRFKFFDANDICMHHMNFVRESFKSKLVNTSSAANPDFIRKAKNALNDWRWPNDFVFPNKPKYKIVEVEDVFQLQQIKYVYQAQPKKKILLTNYFIREFTGSEMAIFDLAREFLKRGYDVTIGAFIFSDPLLSEFASLGVTLLDLNNASTEHFSLIWAQHFITLDTCLIDSGITADKIVYSSLSPYESLESPPVSVKYVNLFLANSSETKNVLVSMGLDECDVIIFPNPVNQSFFSKKKIHSQGLKRLAIVSNHIPTEIEQVAEQLRQKGVEVKEFGMSHEFVLITPEVLNNFDAVITIGRTVQYCLAMGIPIYCYDRFGGPGWINIDNIDRAALYNFSGRCVGTKKQADDIESELINNFETTQTQAKFYEGYAKLHFDLENQLDRVLGSLISGQKTDIEQCPKTVLNIINRQRKFTQDLIRNILHNNHIISEKDHIISEKDHIISEKDHIISEKDHIILNREQQLLAQSLQHSKYKKLWVNRLVKPLIKTEQAISSANTLRKGFGRLVKEKGSIGKAYQHLRRLRKTKGVREVKLLLRNQKKVTVHKHLSVREMFSIKHDESQNILSKNPIDIIIPVYNGYDFLRPLFESIIRNTFQRYRLLVVDDCSSDKRVFDLLKEIKTQTKNVDFVLLRNEQNMGFIGSVNKLVAHTKNHFVILNTDTEVPLGWLERLMYPILRMDKVASTTPFTNSGTICSFPRYLDDNSLFLAKSVEFIDGFFRKVNFDSTFIEIPTGVGFCMGVNKQLVKQIGMFDPVYGKGYGEENDWCQKAISKGYRNIHVTNLFVYHKHGGSFATDEKLRLMEKNSDILNKRYPNYNKDISQVINENCLKDLRDVLAMEIVSNSTDLTVLIEHSLGGGAGSYVNDLLKDKLKNNGSVLRVKFDFSVSKKYVSELVYGTDTFQYVADNLDELSILLERLEIKEIFINSVVSYPEIDQILLMLLDLKAKKGARLVFPLHDFFSLCPSYTLVNENDHYCGIPDDYAVCARCLNRNTNDFKQLVSSTDITQWRKTWGNLLHHCDEIRCFSQSSIDIFEKCYPEHHVRLTLIPHNISGRFENIYELLSDEIKQSNIIGVLGGINRSKGLNIIKQMVRFIEDNNLDVKVVVVGQLSEKIKSKAIDVTGAYDVDDLPNMIIRKKIAKFFIPSVCPETYSYTTDEVMQLGYPLYVFNIGAPAERVLNYPLGRVIQFNEWKSIVQNNRTESV